MTSAAWLRERDARAVLLALLAILVGIAVTPSARLPILAVLLIVIAVAGHVSVGPVLRRSAMVLPFALFLALAAIPARGWEMAAVLAGRAWISALYVVVAVESATAPRLFSALARLGCPQPLVTVLQFVYRFVSVLAGVASNIRAAALARGVQRAGRRRMFGVAAGTIAVLFARALGRATRIHQAMVARGYRGQIPSPMRERMRVADGLLIIGAVALVLTIRTQ
ncbi:MAG TPA: energy-coupling factor transporter transmembrane component T [Bryobacteraceae bacterium]|nr:energy-coupling factor transporter transmembrane component T [Bryobacteraceae bacterium]